MKVFALILLLELSSRIDGQGCTSFPSAPANARASCRLNTCTFTCVSEYQFPDASTVTTATCNSGAWVPTNKQWTTVPDCQKSCTPQCVNEGTCLSYDICQCPQKFRGPQCQYSVDVCTGAKLNFNGDYKCRGNSVSFVCTLSCPEGINFDRTPQSAYTCEYDTGRFDATTPNCVYAANMETSIARPNSGYILEINNVTKMNNGQEVTITVPEYITIDNQAVTVISIVPRVCFVWGDGNIKTFDGKVYSASSNCEEVLATDLHGGWTISTIKSSNGDYRIIHIKIGDQDYNITKSAKGDLIVLNRNNQYSIPVELDYIKIDIINDSVVIKLKYLDITVKWDTELLVQVELTESGGGLCGFPDGNPDNDIYKEDGSDASSLTDFLESWSLTKPCNSISEVHACNGLATAQSNANDFCTKLLSVPKFSACYKLLPDLMNACTWDYCKCSEECACVTLNVVDRNCIFNGVTNDTAWRDADTCPLQCTNGRVYMNCQPERGEPTCTSLGKPNTSGFCTAGCYCPVDTYLYNGACVPKAQCPCIKNGQEYFPGSVIPDDCNNCTCTNGDWSCTTKDCRGVCTCLGDPHFTTFDEKYYNFMGLCNYYLLKMGSISVEGENAQWLTTTATITESVIINIYNQRIKLKQGKAVEINGIATTATLPIYIPGATIRTATSQYISVLIFNGVEVQWDGIYSVIIYVQTKHKGLTHGLCGTYNGNQNDDFLTPINAIVTDETVFGDSWLTGERCNNVTTVPPNTCLKQEDKDFAVSHCDMLKSSLFSPCHQAIPVDPVYEDCLYDMCTCSPQTTCLCTMFASYATRCSNLGINIDWVNQVPQCSTKCYTNQTFSSCSNPCTRTCNDISNSGNCPTKCIEGCICPDGQTLDDNNICIPISECTCQYNGIEYEAGYKEVRTIQTIPQLCTCENAVWSCIPATHNETITYPPNMGKCDMDNNFEFTNCVSIEPTTCLNMLNDEPRIGTGSCTEGCQCQDGYVLNSVGNKCIKPIDCICEDTFIQQKTISLDSLRQIYDILNAST